MGFFSSIKNFFGGERPAKNIPAPETGKKADEAPEKTGKRIPPAAGVQNTEKEQAGKPAAEGQAGTQQNRTGEQASTRQNRAGEQTSTRQDGTEKQPAARQNGVEEQPGTRQGGSAGSERTPEEERMIVRLREAEPKLSAWLNIVLEGVTEADGLLWQRLHFLLKSLDAPEAELTKFIDEFRTWLERMEYRWVDEFRSELQYRLALALELEDEEDERSRLFLKLSEGLSRTREQFARQMDAVFSQHKELDEAFWEEMEEVFITADLGCEPAMELVRRLKERARKAGVADPGAMRALLRAEVESLFKAPRRITAVNPPEVILMVGVNGVGKTTTIAKLAYREKLLGKKVLIAAADTFRAAAVEQLKVWADRVGADFHCKNTGADPAAVAFEAMDLAMAGGYDVLFVDTAGRLQTKVNLMEELTKIRTILGKKHHGAPHRTILVIDATTGQNALSQTKLFKEASGVDELILTKLDGTAKGGVAIAVAMQHNLPITYVGLGEKMEDLRPFNSEDYAAALLGEKS